MVDVGGGVIGRPITKTKSCEVVSPRTFETHRIPRRARTLRHARRPAANVAESSPNRTTTNRIGTSSSKERLGLEMPKTRKQRKAAEARLSLSPFLQQAIRARPGRARLRTPIANNTPIMTPARLKRRLTPRRIEATPRISAPARDPISDELRSNRPRRTDHSRALDKFFGTSVDELHDWLFQVDAIADADDWTDKEKYKIALVMLQGRARTEVLAFERRKASRGQQID